MQLQKLRSTLTLPTAWRCLPLKIWCVGYLPRAHTLISRPAESTRNPEIQTKQIYLIRGQKELLVGTLNVRTLREQYKRNELATCFQNSGVGILGIQEHRIVHSSEIEYQNLGNCTLITASACRNSGGAATGGVGIVVDNKTVLNSLTSVYKHDHRTLVANFAGNPITTVIVTYSPTGSASIIDAEYYYESLLVIIFVRYQHITYYWFLEICWRNGNLIKGFPIEMGNCLSNRY